MSLEDTCGAPGPFSLLIKPASADCNLRCGYCFYLPKARLYPGSRRMSRATLERLVAGYMATEQPRYTFGWQGGEPTLLGAGFFSRVVELQSRYGRPGAVVANGVQTNATRVTEELAELFARYRFLVGVSIDGPRAMHDAVRTTRGGAGSLERVLAGVGRLVRQGVPCNALVAVSRANADRPQEIYRFLLDQGLTHHQYIPIVELQAGGGPEAWTVASRQWGRFLLDLFETWYPDRFRVSVRLFDAILARLVDGEAAMCTMGSDCRSYFLVEHNGDVYPCDFYVEPAWRLGNIREDGWTRLAASARYREFGARKTPPAASCGACAFAELCAGDCPRHRPEGGGGVSWLCEGWRMFYQATLGTFRRLARGVLRQRTRELEARLARGRQGTALGP